jgi:hypothetical protein
LELTLKGWRIASLHTDSMNGDYRMMGLHVKYFESIRGVLPVIESLECNTSATVARHSLVAIGRTNVFFPDEVI